jgi:hypothetical protein
MDLQKFEKDRVRLSDRLLTALELALDQNDLKISELLSRALEISMTRNAGGGEFVERRDYPPEMEIAMDRLNQLREHKI